MQDKDLKKLSDIPVQRPSDAARKAALSAARQAFEQENTALEQKTEKNKFFFQGTSLVNRLTDSFIQIRSFIMDKKFASGITAASVAVIAGLTTYSMTGTPNGANTSSQPKPLTIARPASEMTVADNTKPAAEKQGIAGLVKEAPSAKNASAPMVKKEARAKQALSATRNIGIAEQPPTVQAQKTLPANSPWQQLGDDQPSPARTKRHSATSKKNVPCRKGAHKPNKPKPAQRMVQSSKPSMAKRKRSLGQLLRVERFKLGGQMTQPYAVSHGAMRVRQDHFIAAPEPTQNRDKFANKTANPVNLTATKPVSTFSIDVDTASYAFVRRSLNSGHLPPKQSVRLEELINYFNYNYVLPAEGEAPFKPTIAVYPTPWNKNTKLLHIGIKGRDIIKAQKPRANLVFLLDTSGSMHSQDKLPLMVNSLRLLVNTMADEDSIAIVTYAGRAGTVLEPTKGKQKHKILAALDRLTSGGSTAGAQGIKQAYALAQSNFDKEAVNRVILATDGDFNVGIRDPKQLKQYIASKRKTGIFLSVLGFGRGNYNDALMQALAQNGNGNAAYIDTLNEARKVLVDEAGSTLFTIAKDVKIQIEFNPHVVAEYRLIGYETRMLKREDFNNDKVDAGEIGSGHSVTAIYEITPVGSQGQLVDPLRYQAEKPANTNSATNTDEYAFLKIRYKNPAEDKSKLMTVPITKQQSFDSVAQLPEDLRFAAAVASFGQLLKGSRYTQGFSYKDVLKLAQSARGKDPFGYRSEFLNMVRLAQSLQK